MKFSRSYTIFVTIGVSTILLYVAATSDENPELSIGVLSLVGNFIGVISIALMAVGIYWAVFSKTCALCGDIAPTDAIRCQDCGHKFQTAKHLRNKNLGLFRFAARGGILLKISGLLRFPHH
jgi:hypothetical protein